jgi:hypothetical protein
MALGPEPEAETLEVNFTSVGAKDPCKSLMPTMEMRDAPGALENKPAVLFFRTQEENTHNQAKAFHENPTFLGASAD